MLLHTCKHILLSLNRFAIVQIYLNKTNINVKPNQLVSMANVTFFWPNSNNFLPFNSCDDFKSNGEKQTEIEIISNELKQEKNGW